VLGKNQQRRETLMKLFKSFLLFYVLIFYAPMNMAAEEELKNGLSMGTVAETVESGGYSYLRLEEQDIWIATTSVPVSVGDQVQYSGGMEMRDFHSKSLDRTFESIFFVQRIHLVGNGAEKGPAMAGPGSGAMQIFKPEKAEAPGPGEIKPLSDGMTIAAVFSQSEQLKDQTIRLSAKVIKINKAIMGRNWVTLQDGTGTEPNNKLLATSQEVVSPGDIVTVEGIIQTDIDLGYGYKYEVLLEEATFLPVTE
jgi:hypothetical protein